MYSDKFSFRLKQLNTYLEDVEHRGAVAEQENLVLVLEAFQQNLRDRIKADEWLGDET